eukprot:TRINITY_DN16608_c0_g1_i1.p1 TRINITY_DN16608_c0_g1~~TRINITY_DN16608_c0_g1_i1.p1  ORF type:complete len:821 (+),score=218.94 TRINITY_DN16608_c0_g1_i1:91-2553(+)
MDPEDVAFFGAEEPELDEFGVPVLEVEGNGVDMLAGCDDDNAGADGDDDEWGGEIGGNGAAPAAVDCFGLDDDRWGVDMDMDAAPAPPEAPVAPRPPNTALSSSSGGCPPRSANGTGNGSVKVAAKADRPAPKTQPMKRKALAPAEVKDELKPVKKDEEADPFVNLMDPGFDPAKVRDPTTSLTIDELFADDPPSPLEPKAKRQKTAQAAKAKAKKDEKKPPTRRGRPKKEEPAKEKDEALMTPFNSHGYVIHDGISRLTTLAASPLNPSALTESFTYLKSINAIHAAEEAWHPLIEQFYADKGLAEQKKSSGDDGELPTLQPLDKPACVTCIVLKPNMFSKWRNKQLDWKTPFNVWYRSTKDTTIDMLHASLKPSVKLHSHQQEAVGAVCQHGHAGSGTIVLPCGSGKTLTGIALACKVNRCTLILCNTLTSVAQWQAAVRQFCNFAPGSLKMGVFSVKHPNPVDCNLVFTTYSILSCDRGMSSKSNQGRMIIELQKWGLVLLDEVHVVPTKTFVTALGRIKYKCAIGLTATPLREDGKISDLPYLVGPMTFYEEEEWKRLTQEGFLAKVECVEVSCGFDPLFKAEYEKMRTEKVKGVKKELVATINPTKLRCCHALMLFHEQQGDKVLIFCDTLFTLHYMEKEFGRPMIAGATKEDTKIEVLNNFRLSEDGCTILFSRVGDTSIDLPEANVIIEVGAHFGSRCQETQRFGRVSRPKVPHDLADPNDAQAYFYSLLTDDSEEMRYGQKRKQFLVEKGYDFTSVSGEAIVDYHLNDPSLGLNPLCLETHSSKNDLLEAAKAPKRAERQPKGKSAAADASP